jgi:hypothetical protein
MSAKKSESAKKTKKKRGESRLGQIVRAIDTAGRDADLARRSANDPAFRRQLQQDRRGTLSSFRAVKQALADREKIEKAKKKD